MFRDGHSFVKNNLFLSFTSVIFLLYYALFPALVFIINDNVYFLRITLITVVSVASIVAGYYFKPIKFFRRKWFEKIEVQSDFVICVLTLTFLVVFVAIAVTAPSIPLISAFNGADGMQLSLERAAFSKLRTGWESIFPYANAALTSVVLPYLIALVFLEKSKYRWLVLFLAILYCQLTIEKSLFIKILLPIIYLQIIGKVGSYRHILYVFVGIVGLLYVNTVISKSTPETQVVEQGLSSKSGVIGAEDKSAVNACGPRQSSPDQSAEKNHTKWSEKCNNTIKPFIKRYFSAKYLPINAVDYVVWRTLVVPVYTAADYIYTFETVLNGVPLLGATSAPIAMIMGVEKVEIEALVFGVQWGTPGVASPYGRSNSFYATEAFANFGWLGVMAFSLFVGFFIRIFSKSEDYALQGLFFGFVFNIFSAGFIGTLLSGGFILVFISASLFDIVKKNPTANKHSSI